MKFRRENIYANVFVYMNLPVHKGKHDVKRDEVLSSAIFLNWRQNIFVQPDVFQYFVFSIVFYLCFLILLCDIVLRIISERLQVNEKTIAMSYQDIGKSNTGDTVSIRIAIWHIHRWGVSFRERYQYLGNLDRDTNVSGLCGCPNTARASTYSMQGTWLYGIRLKAQNGAGAESSQNMKTGIKCDKSLFLEFRWKYIRPFAIYHMFWYKIIMIICTTS